MVSVTRSASLAPAPSTARRGAITSTSNSTSVAIAASAFRPPARPSTHRYTGELKPAKMAASRMVSRNARIMATNAAEMAVTSRSRKAWRKRVSVMTRPEHSDLYADSSDACGILCDAR